MELKLKIFFIFIFYFFLHFPVLQTASLPNPKPFSSKPPMTLLFETQNPKKEKNRKEYLISLTLSLLVCVYVSFLLFGSMILSFSLSVCVSVSFLLFWSMILSLSLSLSGQNNERGCDDGFVDVKSVKVSGITEKGPRLSKSGSYIGSWEVNGIVDRRIGS